MYTWAAVDGWFTRGTPLVVRTLELSLWNPIECSTFATENSRLEQELAANFARLVPAVLGRLVLAAAAGAGAGLWPLVFRAR